ncbi:Ileal sodium/bile acid cotransporter-like protein [Leptotrombidium deliense]|uniref:Ileal sodium/bile acid cotransporter-like protein n=1 Tax=Leptotrombidium deliense TaxID=299467 RepID=A0A443S915_9ACAR|nr:Ileal sodium/bile acid cotransporter-like protein [Leptotrombidium deliense]
MASSSGITEALIVNVSSFVMNTMNETNDVSAKMLTPSSPPLIKKIHDMLITTLLLAVMFAMGCSITFEEVMSHLKKPIGVITGMISQFFLLPFSAFCLVTFLKIDALHAAGLLILASSPGGVTSNIFTFFCDGDISLR